MIRDRCKILIIDDDAAVLHALGMFLEQEDYEVETADSYGGRLDKIKPENLPDIIILDILLSDENGTEIAKQLKANHKTADIPIVMISAHPHGKKMSLGAGADAFLSKPFDAEQLLSTLERFDSSVAKAA